jgi:hypothetical protein
MFENTNYVETRTTSGNHFCQEWGGGGIELYTYGISVHNVHRIAMVSVKSTFTSKNVCMALACDDFAKFTKWTL